jgi:hypothetical protein
MAQINHLTILTWYNKFMSAHTIDLKPKVEKSLAELASQRNMSLEEYMVQVLEGAVTGSIVDQEKNSRPKTGREILDKLRREGALFRTDMTEDTVEYAHKLRERSQRRNLR